MDMNLNEDLLSVATGKYQVIYADPPWTYSFSATRSRSIESHYDTLSLGDICNMPVERIADDDAVLFLWTTAPKLEESLQVIKSWRFKYKTHAVWDKVHIGTGYWFRGRHELLMVATRGEVKPPADSVRVSSVIRASRTRHSAKPAMVYEYIEQWYPCKRKIELFARVRRSGWDSFGNEIDTGYLV